MTNQVVLLFHEALRLAQCDSWRGIDGASNALHRLQIDLNKFKSRFTFGQRLVSELARFTGSLNEMLPCLRRCSACSTMPFATRCVRILWTRMKCPYTLDGMLPCVLLALSFGTGLVLIAMTHTAQ